MDYNARCWPQYARAVELSGGVPIRLPLASPAATAEQADDCSGFVLPGSPADIDPARYGQAADPLTNPADPSREACDNLLLGLAETSSRPLLGICFGLQSMNVWHGGSLVQHLSPMPISHAAGAMIAVAHTVLVAEFSLAATILDAHESTAEGSFRRVPVNTSHHQAVAIPGEQLRVSARSADDGVIEALELSPSEGGSFARFLLGVQWHPERSFDISATSRAIFSRLVSEATSWSALHADAQV